MSSESGNTLAALYVDMGVFIQLLDSYMFLPTTPSMNNKSLVDTLKVAIGNIKTKSDKSKKGQMEIIVKYFLLSLLSQLKFAESLGNIMNKMMTILRSVLDTRGGMGPMWARESVLGGKGVGKDDVWELEGDSTFWGGGKQRRKKRGQSGGAAFAIIAAVGSFILGGGMMYIGKTKRENSAAEAWEALEELYEQLNINPRAIAYQLYLEKQGERSIGEICGLDDGSSDKDAVIRVGDTFTTRRELEMGDPEHVAWLAENTAWIPGYTPPGQIAPPPTRVVPKVHRDTSSLGTGDGGGGYSKGLVSYTEVSPGVDGDEISTIVSPSVPRIIPEGCDALLDRIPPNDFTRENMIKVIVADLPAFTNAVGHAVLYRVNKEVKETLNKAQPQKAPKGYFDWFMKIIDIHDAPQKELSEAARTLGAAMKGGGLLLETKAQQFQSVVAKIGYNVDRMARGMAWEYAGQRLIATSITIIIAPVVVANFGPLGVGLTTGAMQLYTGASLQGAIVSGVIAGSGITYVPTMWPEAGPAIAGLLENTPVGQVQMPNLGDMGLVQGALGYGGGRKRVTHKNRRRRKHRKTRSKRKRKKTRHRRKRRKTRRKRR